MYKIRTCPICGKEYNSFSKLERMCLECEIKNFLNSPLKYYVNGGEVTKEAYDEFTGGNCNE